MLVLILGLVLFLGIHSVRMAAPGFRDAQIAARGIGPWKGIYSIVAALGLVLIVWGYSLAWPAAPVLYEPPVWLKHINALLMLFAFIIIASGDLPASHIKAAVKHPMLLAVKIWAFGHLLSNGDLASILLFGSFLVWAVVNRIAVKRRGGPLPVAGPWRNDAIVVAVGVAVYLLFVWKLHLWLFGVPPIPVA